MLSNPTLVSLLSSLPTGVFIVDRQCKVIHINQAGANVLNRQPHECINQPCSELFRNNSCNTSQCCIQQVLTTGLSISSPLCHNGNCQDNPILFHCSPLNDHHNDTMGCVIHLVHSQKGNPPTLPTSYEQLLEQLNNQWAINQELLRQNNELHRVSNTIGSMASEKTAIELVMLMVDRLRNSATCIGGLLQCHLRRLPPEMASTKTSMALQDQICQLEQHMLEIESLLDSRQGLFKTTPLQEILNDALFSCAPTYHERKIPLVLKKPSETITIKACQELLTKALSILFEQLALTNNCIHQAVIEISHDHSSASIFCYRESKSRHTPHSLDPKSIHSLPHQEGNHIALCMAHQIVTEHGGTIKETNTPRQKGYVVSLPKEWQIPQKAATQRTIPT